MLDGSLDGLDTIDWGSLTHAYGTAEDVPGLLRDLRSDDPEVVEAALEWLFSNIFHQGTRYQASSYAVPFLLELAADPAVRQRHAIVQLLAALAIGDSQGHVATRFPIAWLREEVAQLPQEVGQALTRQMNEWLASDRHDGATEFPLSQPELRLLEARHALAAYDAVLQGVPVIAALCNDADAELAGNAVYALAWFPERAEEIVPVLAGLVADGEQPMELVSTALVALGLVAPQGVTTFDELLGVHLEGDEPTLRWSAAVAWAHVAGDAVPAAALEELKASASGCGEDYEDTIWQLTRSQIALFLLDRLAEPVAAEVRAGLVAGELAKTPDSNWHNHFVEVLDYAYPSMDSGHGRSFAELTPAQQAAIVWLVDNPHVFGPFGPDMLLRMYGLPTTHEGLRSYAGVS